MPSRFRGRKFILAAVLAISVLSGLALENILARPFPFLDVTYVRTGGEFNAQPGDFPESLLYPTDISTHVPAWLQAELDKTRNAGIRTQAMTAANLTRQIQSRSSGSEIKGASNIFDTGDRYKAICSESSKIFVSMMTLLGTPARIVWMNGHTVSEIWDGQGWVLFDTYGNVIAENPEGKLMSTLDIISHYRDARFRRLSELSSPNLGDYTLNGYLDRDDNVYRSQDLLFVIDGPSVFTFHTATRDPAKILKSVMAIDSGSIGHGVQYIGGDRPLVGNVGLKLYKRFRPDEPAGFLR